MTETITIPVTDVFDAMEKNELPKVQRTLVTRDGSGAITGACAYGQAALHLGADPESLLQAITDWGRNYHAPIAQEVLDLNDGTDSTIAAIARYAKTKLPWDAKYQTITVRPRSDAAVD